MKIPGDDIPAPTDMDAPADHYQGLRIVTEGYVTDPADDLPEICITNVQMSELISRAWTAIHASNIGPHLFRRDRDLVRVIGSPPRLEVLHIDAVYGIQARAARWTRINDRNEHKAATPPQAIARDMIQNPSHKLPELSSVVSAPVFDTDGTLITTPGYHASCQLWYNCPGALVALDVHDISDSAVVAARNLIDNELFIDFPFVGESDRAHAYAALFLPFVRRLINGASPLHLIEAPTPGSGKGLLADLISIISTGIRAPASMLSSDEAETDKRLISLLMEGPSLILLDNISDGIASPSLASATTSDPWKPRVLGASRMVSLSVRCLWLATGNNLTLTQEIARRVVRIRLDAKVDRPWQRGGFRHGDIRSWAMEHRSDLVSAVLTLCASWISAGRKNRTVNLGSFEQWGGVIGGILDHVAIPGFVADLDQLYESADHDGAEWRAFVAAWAEQFTLGELLSVKQLLGLAINRELLIAVRGFKSYESQLSRFGQALRKQCDRRYDNFTISSMYDSHAKVWNYALK